MSHVKENFGLRICLTKGHGRLRVTSKVDTCYLCSL